MKFFTRVPAIVLRKMMPTIRILIGALQFQPRAFPWSAKINRTSASNCRIACLTKSFTAGGSGISSIASASVASFSTRLATRFFC